MKPSAPRLRTVLIEDDAPFRTYVAGVLTATGRYAIVAEAATAEEAAAWPEAVAPQLALVDYALPGASGGDATRRLLTRFPELPIVIFTGHADDDIILDAVRAGAIGYVLKGTDSAALVAALDDAAEGGAPMTPSIARRVLALLRAPAAPGSTGAAALRDLTPRERDVLTLVADGATDKEAAARLGVSLSAVKQHLANIYAKWRVRSRTEAAIKFTQARR
jgi:DNA-binding NarL/FixJ family response regulator